MMVKSTETNVILVTGNDLLSLIAKDMSCVTNQQARKRPAFSFKYCQLTLFLTVSVLPGVEVHELLPLLLLHLLL